MRIAIMQPYFFPYAGYFRLMDAADLFVFYDCVQFPRRGWVHRNKLTHRNGNPEWLTLPLAKADRDSTRIMDLQWADNAQVEWNIRMADFPALQGDSALLQVAATLTQTPCYYMIETSKIVCAALGITCDYALSSSLALPEDLRGQDRILAIAQRFGASDYINASGGRELYDEATFAARNIRLHFLPEYQGKFTSVLERLLSEPTEQVAAEMRGNML